MDLDEALKQIATYEYGQSRRSLILVAEQVRDSHGDPDRRKQLRKQLTALLTSEATADCKQFVCEQLSIIGSNDEVPELAKLLTDEKLSHMARFALERIPGSASDAALRDALRKAKGNILIGVINSAGERRDREAAGALIRLISDPDDTVAGVAIAALAKIGGPEAVEALAKAKARASPKMRPTVVDALLVCADRLLAQGMRDEAINMYRELCTPTEAKHVRTAAQRGLEAAKKK
jgi:hypothetical protein